MSERQKVTALAAYARQAHDPELELQVAEIRLRAKRRIGELSAALESSKGGANPLATLPTGGTSKREALRAAKLSKSAAQRCEQLAAIPESVFEEYLAEKKAEQSRSRLRSSRGSFERTSRKVMGFILQIAGLSGHRFPSGHSIRPPPDRLPCNATQRASVKYFPEGG